jgi:hypothetical protein
VKRQYTGTAGRIENAQVGITGVCQRRRASVIDHELSLLGSRGESDSRKLSLLAARPCGRENAPALSL